METGIKAVVLAAGKGTRLRTEGVDLPKVLRQARGRALLDYVLSELSFLPGRILYWWWATSGEGNGRLPRLSPRRAGAQRAPASAVQ